MRRHEGFTLIELIAALTIMSLIATVIFASMRIGVNSWRRGSERLDEAQRYRIVSDMLKRQLGSIYPVRSKANVALPTMELLAQAYVQGGVSFGPTPFLRGTSERIEFVSLCSLRFNENPGLTYVIYEIKRSGDKLVFAESERMYLGPETLTSPPAGAEQELVLFDDLEDAMFRYYEKWPNGAGTWWDRWDAEVKGELPAAIELNFALKKDSNNITKFKNFVVPVMAKPLAPNNMAFRKLQQQEQQGGQTAPLPPGRTMGNEPLLR